jgi:hypothetical protein
MPLSLLRLWGVTIVTNLAGGWLITGIIIVLRLLQVPYKIAAERRDNPA